MKVIVKALVLITILLLAGHPIVMCQVQASTGRKYVQAIPATGITFEMTFIPSGNFLMGSPPTEANRNLDEGPQHQVTIDSLWVGKVEVTWELFELFLNENKSLFADLPE